MKQKILIISTVHNWNDVRIYLREAMTLANAGYDIELAAVATAENMPQNIKIRELPQFKNRLMRAILGSLISAYLSLTSKATIIHFHDPELIPIMFFVSFFKKVIYDNHENLHDGLKDKHWIPLKKFTLPAFLLIERIAMKRFSIVLAETSHAVHYQSHSGDLEIVQNFPDYSFFVPYQMHSRSLEQINLFYVGGVTSARGIVTTLAALKILKDRSVPFSFHCIGPFQSAISENEQFKTLSEELGNQVIFYNRLSLHKAYEISKKCNVGIALLKRTRNYYESYPTKLFEYMAIGMPYITSNFPLYAELDDETKSGIYLDPDDAEQLATSLQTIIANKEQYQSMVMNGIRAVSSKYNWDIESQKLVKLYQQIFANKNLMSLRAKT